MTTNSSNITSKDILEISYSVVDSFLKNHNLTVLDNRLLSNFKGELDAVEVLRAMWSEMLQGSPEKLVDFYEQTYNKTEKVHYENVIDTVLIELAVGLVSTVVGGIIVDEYSRKHESIARHIKEHLSNNKKEISLLQQRFEKSLKYLFRVYLAKKYY
jgi:hypothetical protein